MNTMRLLRRSFVAVVLALLVFTSARANAETMPGLLGSLQSQLSAMMQHAPDTAEGVVEWFLLGVILRGSPT